MKLSDSDPDKTLPDGFFPSDESGIGAAGEVPITEGTGSVIGRYKLLQQIGEGGFGVVYMAEQTEPVIRRVALKIIKLGMDTRQVIARFEAERQALALMDHPNIAKVLDAGATESGRPYFVMELVRGVPITEYCDKNHLSARERLELFVPVCQAIQHAHQKGIIHRDIKPSNVLVTLHDGKPIPMVIDFGIAKATNQKLTEKTLFTSFASMIGTPAYMSPEQAEMSKLDVDTRSDIYSLGVLLYELLTGTTPFPEKRLRSVGFGEMQRIIAEEEPDRPSTRFSTMEAEQRTTVAKARSADPARLKTLFRGDLDWIVMKCLEKDRTRRYETVNGLARDIERHLVNEPIAARPPSAAYRFQKIWRRNKLALAAAAGVLLALVVGLTLSLASYMRERSAHQRSVAAEQMAREARENEAKERRNAEANAVRARNGEMEARRLAYASAVNLAQQALVGNNLGRARVLLGKQIPTSTSEVDLRGWEWRYLQGQTRSDALFSLGFQESIPRSLAVTPDGRWLAVGAFAKGKLSLWDLQARKSVEAPPAGNGAVMVTFSPNDSVMAFSTAEQSAPDAEAKYGVVLWDLKGSVVRWRAAIAGRCSGLKFSADGGRLVAGAELPGNDFTIWEVKDGVRISTLSASQISIGQGQTTSFTEDLRYACYGTPESEIRFVDLSNGQERWRAKAGTDFMVQAVAISPDAKLVASSTGWSDPNISLWEAGTGRLLNKLEGHRSYILSLAFSADGKELISGGADQTIRVWNVADVLRPGCENVLIGHKSEVWSLAVVPNSSLVVSGGKDLEVCVWDRSARNRERAGAVLETNLAAWTFTKDSKSILGLKLDGAVVRLSGREFASREEMFRTAGEINTAMITPDLKWIAIGSSNGTITVWEIETKSLVRTIKGKAKPPVIWNALGGRHRVFVGYFGENTQYEWDFISGELIGSWQAPENLIDQFYLNAITPDEKWLLQPTLRLGRATLRNLDTGEETERTGGAGATVFSVAFSTSGEVYAYGMNYGGVLLFDRASGNALREYRGFLQSVSWITFSADDSRLVAASDGKEALKLLDAYTLQELITLEGSGSAFQQVAFSPDGSILGAMNVRGMLQIWRAAGMESFGKGSSSF